MKKIIFTGSVLIVILLAILVLRMLGYQFNKDYLSFNKQQCIEREYPTYDRHSGIQGCVFWMRSDSLEKTQDWKGLFKRDDEYCSKTYPKKPESTWDSINLFAGQYSDPKCEYEAFKQKKIAENWNMLVSKDKDGFYNYCVNQICPNPKMFK